MQPPAPPKINAVEVEAAKPTEADSMAIAQLSADTNRSLPPVPFTVKVRLQTKPPVTSMAWALYVGDVLIPKYWEYEDGIYFTVLDPQFFSDHKGKPLRFSQNGIDFSDTGMKLPAPSAPAAARSSKGRAAARSSKGKAAARSSKGKAARPSKAKAAKSSKRKAAKSSKRKAAKSSKGKVR
jgi:hypothetical protein